MSFEKIDLSLPAEFANEVRLFPLPNLVMYPGVLQGLHIFEPRYRVMLSDAIASDNLIAMAVIKSGVLQDPAEEKPELFPTVCIGKIVTHTRLEDGRSNILLVGSHRAEIVEEHDTELPYRTARVKLLQNRCECSDEEISSLRDRLVAKFRQLVERAKIPANPVKHILANQLPFELVADLISFSMSSPAEQKMEVLQSLDLVERAKLVLRMLDRRLTEIGSEQGSSNFPPDFSLN